MPPLGCETSKKTHVYRADDGEWEEVEDMISPRYGLMCGLAVTSAGSQEVVAAGGYFVPGLFVQYFSDAVEIFSLDTRSWRNGK